MITIGMDDTITRTIALLIKIQGDKKYTENDAEFVNMYSIIKGILDESRGINSNILKELLSSFNKREGEKFKLIKQIMTEMKNLLAAPVNQLMFNITNSESKKSKTTLLDIEEDSFTCLIKNLCKISQEYLISFLSTIPTNIIKATVRGVSYINILNAIFSNLNSLTIAKTYTQLFNSYLEMYNNKTVKESDRLKIFISLLKFLYRNNKKDVKASSLYKLILQATKNFFAEVKSEVTFLAINNILLTKYVNSKYKLPKGVLNLTEAFLDHKNIKLIEDTIETYFTIIQKKLLIVSLSELYSNEKKMFLKKYSFLFNTLVTRYSYYDKHKIYRLKDCFNQNLWKLFDSEPSKTAIILFYLTLTDSSANNILNKYFMDCLDLYEKNLQIITKNLNNDLYETEFTIKPLVENELSRNLLTDLFIKRKEMTREERLKYLNNLQKDIDDCECAEQIRRSFLIYFSHSEISNLLDYTNQLLFTINGENLQSNEFLQSILSVIFYYIYLQHYTMDMSQNYKDNCNIVLDVIKTFLEINVTSRNIINYIKIILTNLYQNSEIFKQKIKSILNVLFDFAYEHHRATMKLYTRLFLDINKIDGVFDLPETFETYLLTNENKLASLIFINEILKHDKIKYNNLLFTQKYQEYILLTLDKGTNEKYCNILSDLSDEEEISKEIKSSLSNLIVLRYEILTYEFYLNLITTNSKEYLKMIFTRLYSLTSQSIHHEVKPIEQLYFYLNNLNINKCINVVFKFFDNDLSIKQKYIIRLSNLAIYNNIVVRNHFLDKLENVLNHKNISMASLSLVPISSLFFNDPDRLIKRRSNQLFTDYLKLLVKKYDQYKNDEISKIRIYKFLPEFVLSNILMFFIFNSNLNKYFHAGHTKYFESIIISYFKLMRKVCSDKYDSNLLIQNCLKIKKSNLKSQKIIKKISEDSYLKLSMSKATLSMEITSSLYDSVKNELTDLTIKIINTDFCTKFRRENMRTILDQSIFNSRVSEISYENKENDFIPQSELKEHLNELKDLSNLKIDSSIVQNSEINNLTFNVIYCITFRSVSQKVLLLMRMICLIITSQRCYLKLSMRTIVRGKGRIPQNRSRRRLKRPRNKLIIF
jgi:hypothetical protein